MNMRDTFPVLRRVEVMGRTWAIHPLRLRDLAQMEAWACDRRPSPLDEGRAALRSAPPEKRPRMAAKLLDGVMATQFEIGSEGYEAEINTPDGILLFLSLVLRESSVTSDELAALAAHLYANPDELEKVRAVAYGVDPVQYLVRVMEGTPDQPSGLTWGKALYAALREHPAWTPNDVGEMTLSQWVCVQSEGLGGVDVNNVPPRPGETLEQMSERRRKLFEPDPEPEPEAAADA